MLICVRQKGECEGEEDASIIIPDNWWLNNINTKCLLACMVHRQNKELVNDCTAAPPGQTRETQRRSAQSRLVNDRSQDRAAIAATAQDNDPDLRLQKKMRLSIAQMSVIKAQSDVVSMQIKLLNENKDSYVSRHGADKWQRKITDLLDKLPDLVQDLLSQPTVNNELFNSDSESESGETAV